jgi:hypothetical protein
MDSIQNKYIQLCNVPSDINEHLPILYKYATECESIFETGVRGVVSSWAFVYGLLNNNKLNKVLLMNDLDECNIDELLFVTKDLPIKIPYIWGNNLNVELYSNFDMTFIDTWHVYGQLKRELAKFSKTTNKYIIMHDTTVDEWLGETIRLYPLNAKNQSIESGIPIDEINKGLWPAIEEFLASNKEWVLHERFINCNGLTVLKRIS